MKTYWKFALASLITAPLLLAHAESTLVILRHGEKPEAGLGQLSCQGLNRALALPHVLLSRYGKPASLHAPNPSVLKEDHGTAYAYIRPLATIEPLAIEAQMPVSVEWGMRDIDLLAKQLLQFTQGVHIIAWEHHLAVSLAQNILTQTGDDPKVVPDWPDDDYDSLYVIRISQDSHGASHAKFTKERQDLDHMPIECPVASRSRNRID